MRTLLLMATLIWLNSSRTPAATAIVPVAADTSLHEFFPNNNMGRSLTVNAGAIAQDASGTGGFGRVRGLFRYDLAGIIPANAAITAVTVNMRVIGTPPGAPSPSTFQLQKMLKAWTEGTKSGNSGGAAAAGESTWNRQFAGATASGGAAWGSPGASSSSDVSNAVSSSTPVVGIGAYVFPSSAQLVADVQGWLNDPNSNFGWMLRSTAEGERQSARRFGPKETASVASFLEVTYTVPPAEIRITQFRREPAGVFLAWTDGAPPYVIQRADNVLGPWNDVTPPSASLEATAPLGETAALYRVAGAGP